MSAETSAGRDRGAGAGMGDASPADRPEQRPWRLRALLAELRDNAGDLLAHLWTHWRLIAGLGAAALCGAALFAWSGVYSVAATSGHYPFFRYFLAFALRQSVETHTAGWTARLSRLQGATASPRRQAWRRHAASTRTAPRSR